MEGTGEGIVIEIHRSDPRERSVFHVNFSAGMTLHDALEHIYRELDPSLGYRPFRCNKGVCLSCLVSVNGRRQQACTTLLNAGDRLRVEAETGERVIRDLATAL